MYAAKLDDLERRVLDSRGALDPAIRQAAAAGGEIPEDLESYVDKVRQQAYEVTDGDIESLLAAGYSEDEIFEITVAAAYGAARLRLNLGLKAMAAPSVVEPTPDQAGGK